MLEKLRTDFGIVTIASLVSFAASLVLTPLMTRAYLPSDYGTFSLVNNIATVLANTFVLSLPNALPITTAPRRRAQLLRALSHLAASSFVLSALAVGVMFGAGYFRDLSPALAWSFALLPALVLSIAGHRIVQGWAIADGAFRPMAAARMLHPWVAKPAAVAASLLTGVSNPVYIVFFECLGYLLQIITMLRGRTLETRLRSSFFKRRQLYATMGAIVRHRAYSVFDNLVNLVTLSAIALQTVVLAHSYSVAQTGLFALATSMAGLPVQLVALATAPVIYHRLVEAGRDAPHALFRRALAFLGVYAVLAVAPYFVIIAFGPWLFGAVFGSEWIESGTVAALLSPQFALQFMLSPISSVFRVTETIRLQFMIDTGFTIPILATFYAASQSRPFLEAVALLSFLMCLYRAAVILIGLRTAWRFSQRAGAIEGCRA